MTHPKKQEVALYATGGIAVTAMCLISGNPVKFLGMLLAYAAVVGIMYGVYNAVIYLLNKIYPENKTQTKGATKTYTTDYKI